jgi:HEAT repeat protein
MWSFFNIYGFLYEAYEQIGLLPLPIQIALVFILVAFTATVVAYISILVRRWRAYTYEKRLAAVIPKVEDLITEQVLLNEQLGQGVPVEEIEFDKKALDDITFKKKWVRQCAIDTLMQYRKNFRGEVGELLKKLYVDMGLSKDSFDKMKDVRWERQVKAIMELTSMDVPISDVTLLPLTNSRNPSVRAVARNAYIQLSKNDPFKFFDIATEPLLPWDQLEMFRIITTSKEIQVPNFSRWVSYSTNKSVVSFCLKLIVHYNQKSAIPAVMELLNNKDHYFRADAIACLGKLSAEIAEPRMLKIYDHQPLMCQIEILKAIGNISSGKHLEFLEHEFTYSSNFDIRMNAARAIINHESDDSRRMVNDLLATTHDENRIIIKHCLNPLIKS